MNQYVKRIYLPTKDGSQMSSTYLLSTKGCSKNERCHLYPKETKTRHRVRRHFAWLLCLKLRGEEDV